MLLAQPQPAAARKPKLIKCVVWDLDNTLWDGVLLEDPTVTVRPEAIAAIRLLDERGILHSIASRNDEARALSHLAALDVRDWLVCPQVNWGAKSESIRRIADQLRLGLDTFAFLDDDPFERAEVAAALPEVLILEPADVAGLADRPEMNPAVITGDARSRRLMYQAEIERSKVENEYAGSSQEFLASLAMKLTVSRATAADLGRAEELILRTNQLNSTGYTYSEEQLSRLCQSEAALVLVARLTDRFGSYGTIALAVVELGPAAWTVKLLLASCRVLSRGVAPMLLNCILCAARRAGATLRAELIANEVNRPMQILLRLAGFHKVAGHGQHSVLEMAAGLSVPAFPEHVDVQTEGFEL